VVLDTNTIFFCSLRSTWPAKASAMRIGASVVDQQVDGRVRVLADHPFEVLRVRHIQHLDADETARTLANRLEFGRACRVASAGDHVPAGGGVLARELEPEAAARAGDQGGRHAGLQRH
jgi:hypothetical protein